MLPSSKYSSAIVAVYHTALVKFWKDFSAFSLQRFLETRLGYEKNLSRQRVVTQILYAMLEQKARPALSEWALPIWRKDCLFRARIKVVTPHFQYYIHSPYELPDSSQSFFLITGRMDRDVAFSSLETTVTPEIDKLTPFQRRCRFMYEPSVPHLPVYSFNLCRMQCRKELSFKLCGCAPYFYPPEGNERV